MNNSDLAHILGNLVHRATNLTQKYCDGVVPTVDSETYPFDVRELVLQASTAFDNLKLQDAVNAAMNAVRRLNEYFTEREPWKLKGDEHAETRRAIVRTALEGLYICTPPIQSIYCELDILCLFPAYPLLPK